MENTKKVQIIKQWTVKKWLFWKDIIKVQAEQVELPEAYGCMEATAKVTIYVNGKIVHEADIPWMAPKGKPMLAHQVYILSKKPGYEYPEWQPIMEQFSLECENFSPPNEMWWGDESPMD